MAGGADLDGPLVDYRAKGNRVELAGIVNVDGHDAYHLHLIMADRQERFEDVDCQTFLDVRWQGVIHTPAGDRVAESYFRDYRVVDGLKFAHVINSSTQGIAGHQTIVFERIDVN